MSGFTWLNALGLFALGALAIPVVIHLFSRSRGRRVWVGNIDLYRQPRQQRVLEPRVQQWLLLLLRLLLLACAAFWLADLARDGRPTLQGDSVYVTPRWLASASNEAIQGLGGDQRFLITPRFPALEQIDARGEPGLTSGTSTADIMSLLTTRLSKIEHTGEVEVYATSVREQFPADLVGVGPDVQWHFSDPVDTDMGAPQPRLEVAVVHSADRMADAQQVASVLKLAGDRGDWAVDVSVQMTPPVFVAAEPSVRKVVVALGADASMASAQAALVLEDSVNPSATSSFLRLSQAPGERFRVFPATPKVGARVLWTAEDGRPVLISTEEAGQTRLVFLDRLTELDGGLMRSAAFPDVLLRLLLGEGLWAQGFTGAAVDPRGVLESGAAASRPAPRSLADWLAMLVVILVLAERLLAERRQPMGRS